MVDRSRKVVVEVMSCSGGPGIWYSGLVGETLECYDNGDDGWIFAEDVDRGPKASWGHIRRDDGRVLSSPLDADGMGPVAEALCGKTPWEVLDVDEGGEPRVRGGPHDPVYALCVLAMRLGGLHGTNQVRFHRDAADGDMFIAVDSGIRYPNPYDEEDGWSTVRAVEGALSDAEIPEYTRQLFLPALLGGGWPPGGLGRAVWEIVRQPAARRVAALVVAIDYGRRECLKS